jgi:eukaryotic-like serine/threonine-protein kinase
MRLHLAQDRPLPDPVNSTSESELRAHIERALSAEYDVEKEIGRGGMGVVYRARDRRLKRTVAIKVLPPELAFRGEIRTRFLREAETAAQLSHPSIVPIYSVGEQDRLVFFVMACVDGDNIAKRLHDKGRFSPEDTRRILRDVADALAYAHSRGVIHRDIKPDNVILDAATGRAMVTDFGIARAVSDGDSRLTATGIAIGTPAFMSPEQSAGDRDIDGRSDLYSLGIVGYQMLTGDLPFSAANTPAMLMKHISERPAPIDERCPDLPADLSRSIMLLLEKEPDDRFADAAALVAALDGGEVPSLRPHNAGTRTSTDRAQGERPQGGVLVASRTSGVEIDEARYEPSAEELRRWHAGPVEKYRKKLAPYVAVNAVILFFALFGRGGGLLTITVFWSVYMAFKYAGLWSEGYDWRDVFRQPRHRELLEVASEAIDEASALFDKDKRRELRERSRRRGSTPRTGSYAPSPATGQATRTPPAAPREPIMLPSGDPRAIMLQQARTDHDEIVRLVDSMSREERSRIPDVVASAAALRDRVESLARASVHGSAGGSEGAGAVIEQEIARLEAQANPLDRDASEARVRRLAFLKRQRRAAADFDGRRAQTVARMESCSIALENMRLDVLRLRAGTQTHQHVTSIAEQAMSLAQDVDATMYAADEVSRVTAREGGTGRGTARR